MIFGTNDTVVDEKETGVKPFGVNDAVVKKEVAKPFGVNDVVESKVAEQKSEALPLKK